MEPADLEQPPGKNTWPCEINILSHAKSPVFGEIFARTGLLRLRRKEEMIRLKDSGCSTGGR